MINYWRSLSFNTKFSALAFPTAAGISLLSMGLWGALLYFPARPLLTAFPAFEDWHGAGYGQHSLVLAYSGHWDLS